MSIDLKEQIIKWRNEQSALNKDCSYISFFKSHNLCFHCKGLIGECLYCDNSGKWNLKIESLFKKTEINKPEEIKKPIQKKYQDVVSLRNKILKDPLISNMIFTIAFAKDKDYYIKVYVKNEEYINTVGEILVSNYKLENPKDFVIEKT